MLPQQTPIPPNGEIVPSYPPREMHLTSQWRSFQRLCWFCAGANYQELEQPECATERNKYAGIGATVFLTALLAALSGGYAFNLVFGAAWLAFLLGLLWGT